MWRWQIRSSSSRLAMPDLWRPASHPSAAVWLFCVGARSRWLVPCPDHFSLRSREAWFGAFRAEEAVMRTLRVLAAITVVGVFGGIGLMSAQRKNGPITGADIAEIERLYYRYSQGLDFQEEETYLSAWADDAVFTQGDGSKVNGKEELRKRFRAAPPGEGKTTLHVTTNILVTPTDDGGAKGR